MTFINPVLSKILRLTPAFALTVLGLSSAQTYASDNLPRTLNVFSRQFLDKFISSYKPNENAVISGPSLHLALSLAYLGADPGSKTQQELSHVLQLCQTQVKNSSDADSHDCAGDFTLNKNDLAHLYKVFLDDFSHIDQSLDLTVQIHNLALLSTDFTANSTFAPLATEMDTEIQASDFRHKPDQVLQIANHWVSTQTHGKIQSILQKLNKEDMMIILNAIYFKGLWAKEFKKIGNRPFFSTATTDSKNVPMIHQDNTVRYFEDNNQQVIELPYKGPSFDTGSRFSMFMFLPKKTDSESARVENEKAAFKNFTPSQLEKLTHDMKPVLANITLPSFKMEMETPAKDLLTQLGLTRSFSSEAEFNQLATAVHPGLEKSRKVFFISDVKNKIFLELTEKGTEAAAVTAVKIGITASAVIQRPNPVIEFKADHPFFFAIRDNSTGTVLFEGVLRNP